MSSILTTIHLWHTQTHIYIMREEKGAGCVFILTNMNSEDTFK